MIKQVRCIQDFSWTKSYPSDAISRVSGSAAAAVILVVVVVVASITVSVLSVVVVVVTYDERGEVRRSTALGFSTEHQQLFSLRRVTLAVDHSLDTFH